MAEEKSMIDVKLLSQPVTLPEQEALHEQLGGECIFLGRTRRETHDQHGELQRLRYEAYEPMAVHVLNELARYAADQWRCGLVRVHHAVGEVPPGEASVLVQVMCGHRAEAFEACRYLIDALKERAPIWKREQWADGTTWAHGRAVPQPGDD